MPSLVIVDCQPEYLKPLSEKDKNRVITEVQNEVTIAQINGDAIICVEGEDCEPTHSEILRCLKGHKRRSIVKKSQENGSKEVIAELLRCRYNRSSLTVCGIYTEHCLKKTVIGLSELLPKAIIDIPIRACCSYKKSKDAFEWAYDLENVFLRRPQTMRRRSLFLQDRIAS